MGLLEICKKSLSFFYLQLIEIVHHNCHHVGILHTNNFTLFFLNAKASTFIHQPFHHTFIYFLFRHYKWKKQKWIKKCFYAEKEEEEVLQINFFFKFFLSFITGMKEWKNFMKIAKNLFFCFLCGFEWKIIPRI